MKTSDSILRVGIIVILLGYLYFFHGPAAIFAGLMLMLASYELTKFYDKK